MNNQRKYELANENVKSLLIKYSTPAIFAMVINSLYNLIDTIFVGQGAGTMAIAGLAISFPIQMLIMSIAQTVGIGSASLISRSLGAGDQRKAEKVAGTSFVIVSVLSIFVTIFGLIFLTPMLRLFGATETILPFAFDYMSIILIGSFFFCFAVSSNSVARAEGNAKVAMYCMIIGAVLNIILDPIFIFGFNMGVRGAAIATVISHFASFLYLVRYFLSGTSLLKIRKEDLIPDFTLIPEIFSIGASSFARNVAGSLLAIILNNSIAYYGTDLHIAIIGVSNRMLMFLLMPMFGLIQGMQPIVGFNYGAKNMQRVKESIKLTVIAATMISTFGFIAMLFFTKPILSIFASDPELIKEGVPVLRILIMVLPVIGFQIVGASLFQAIGKAVPALILSMSRQILFLIPLILIFPRFFGLMGVFFAFPVADLLSTGVTLFWVMKEVKIMDNYVEFVEPETVA